MNTQSRLRRVESLAASNRPDFGASLLDLTNEGYQLTVDLFKPGGSSKRIISIHPSEAAAEAEFNRLIEKYRPKNLDPVLLILYRSTEGANGKY